MDDINFLFAVSRSSERLIIVCGGLLCIWLGYRLFSKAITEMGDLTAEGSGYKIQMQRIGPGVFFALFGAFVLSFSLAQPLIVPPIQGTGSQGLIYAQPVTPAAGESQSVNLRRITAITNLVRYADEKRFPDPANQAQIQTFEQDLVDLRALRDTLIGQVYGRDQLQRYRDISAEAVRRPSVIAEQSASQAATYQAIRELLQE